MKILFVCTGNTCRSPMAEGLFRKLVQERGTGGSLVLGSAGLSALPGQPASENALLACREIGVDLSAHRSRRVTGQELSAWDVFFTMSKTHGYILEQAGVPAQSIYVPGCIEDPFGQDLEAYRRCRDRLAEQLELFYNHFVAPALELEG